MPSPDPDVDADRQIEQPYLPLHSPTQPRAAVSIPDRFSLRDSTSPRRALAPLLLHRGGCSHPGSRSQQCAAAAAAEAERRARCSCALLLQDEFDYFVVVDFEATCEKDTRIYPQEIIEFPSVLVDAATGRLDSAFRRYVRPQHHPVLTDFCRELTGIRQEDVDAGVDLGEALRAHDAWLQAATGGKKGGSFAVVTWGDWDCRTMLESECSFKGLAKPAYFDRWINLRVPFEAAFGGGGRTALQEAVRAAGLEWEGRLHCGLDDARNTARLLAELMRCGVKLGITSSLAPPELLQQQLLPQPKLQVGQCCGAAAAYPCFCGVASRRGVVAVPGQMQGRCFYGCGNWTPAMGAMCPYFMWAA